MKQKSFEQILFETKQDVRKISLDFDEPIISPDGYENERVVFRDSKHVRIGTWYDEHVLNDPLRCRNPTEEEIRILAENTFRILNEETEGSPSISQQYKDNSFIRTGSEWTVTFNGKTENFSNTNKIRFVALLLNAKSKEINVIDLYTSVTGTDPNRSSQQKDGHYSEYALLENEKMTEDQLAEIGMGISEMDIEELSDEDKYKMQENGQYLWDELQNARNAKDPTAIEKASRELEIFRKHLFDEYGIKTAFQGGKISGQVKKPGAGIEKARKNVSNQIKSAIIGIRQ